MNIEAATRVTWFCNSAKESMYLPRDTYMLLNTVMNIRTTYPNKVYQSVQLELVVIRPVVVLRRATLAGQNRTIPV